MIERGANENEVSMSSESSDDKKDERQERLLGYLRSGMTLEEACPKIGVSSRQVRKWRNANPDLDDAVLDAMCLIDDSVERITYLNCIDPDPAHNTLRIFWLKSRRPEVYREQAKPPAEDDFTIDLSVTN